MVGMASVAVEEVVVEKAEISELQVWQDALDSWGNLEFLVRCVGQAMVVDL